jgi:hypothetical protein
MKQGERPEGRATLGNKLSRLKREKRNEICNWRCNLADTMNNHIEKKVVFLIINYTLGELGLQASSSYKYAEGLSGKPCVPTEFSNE